jgi:hypothetical protein
MLKTKGLYRRERQKPAKMVSSGHETVEVGLTAERDENVERKDLTPLEAVEMAKRLEVTEREAAEKRAEEGRRRGGRARHDSSLRVNSPQAERKRAADQIASAVGYSRHTLEKAKAVAHAAQDDPAQYGKVAEEMNATGKVAPAFKQVQKMKGGSSAEKAFEDANLELWRMGVRSLRSFVTTVDSQGGPGTVLGALSTEKRQRWAATLRETADVFLRWAQDLDGQDLKTVSLTGDSHAAVETDGTSSGDQTVAPGSQQDGTAPIEASEDVGQADPPAYPEEISNYFQGLKRKRNGTKGARQKATRRQRIRDVSH